MAFILTAIFFGLCYGALTFYHKDLAICLGGTTLLAAFVLVMYMTKYSPILADAGYGKGRWFDYILVIYQQMSPGLQTAIFVAPAAVIVGRVIAWTHSFQKENNQRPETAHARKARLRGDYEWPGQNP